MASAADPRLANAPGFGLCRKCPYRETAPASLCFACARQTFEGLAPKRCTVCDLQFEAGETACRNPTCARSDRKFGWNYAVAMRSGVLEEAINDYKYRGVRAWATIFGRVLAGFLEEQARTFRQFHIITASPTYVGDGGRPFNHTRVVLEAAARELSAGRARRASAGSDSRQECSRLRRRFHRWPYAKRGGASAARSGRGQDRVRCNTLQAAVAWPSS